MDKRYILYNTNKYNSQNVDEERQWFNDIAAEALSKFYPAERPVYVSKM